MGTICAPLQSTFLYSYPDIIHREVSHEKTKRSQRDEDDICSLNNSKLMSMLIA